MLYFFAGTLASESSALVLFSKFGTWRSTLLIGVVLCVIIFNLLSYLAFRLRGVLRGYFADMEYTEKVLIGLLALLFFVAPSFALRRWEPAGGALALLTVQTVTLAGRLTFAALFLSCAIVHATVLPTVPLAWDVFFGGIFLSLFILGHLFFHIGFVATPRQGVVQTGQLSLLGAVWRPLLIGYACFGLAILTWPFRYRLNISPKQQPTESVSLTYGSEFETFQAAMFRAVTIGTLVVLLVFFYWLHLRWKKRRRRDLDEDETLEAEETMFFSTSQRAPVKARRPRSLRGQIMALFERLTDQLAKEGYPFVDGCTIKEYLETLGREQVLSKDTAERLVIELSRARYEKTTLTKEDVQRFLNLTRETSLELRQWREAKRRKASI
ncbi:MAG: hypothetical protein N2Z21_06485 [Candidatus Sumerlaeaceae bacterium]|nr:hypothetical protein [Candidatus Sumerlaeaceae bacterium]